MAMANLQGGFGTKRDFHSVFYRPQRTRNTKGKNIFSYKIRRSLLFNINLLNLFIGLGNSELITV